MNIVLVEPEIPQNTGNIARTCAATGSHLHLIKPLGFSLADKYLKRAGLDYWNLMTYTVYENFGEFLEKNPGAVCHFASTKAAHNYCDVQYGENDYLVFGRETKGLPEELLKEWDVIQRSCDRNTNRYSEALIYNPSYIMSETEKNLLEMIRKEYPMFCKD